MATITLTVTTLPIQFQPVAVVLSDPTGTYGVKRADTDAVVVAAGTAMTLAGQTPYGQFLATYTYSYVFEQPAPELTYQWYAQLNILSQLVYKGPNTASGAPVPSQVNAIINTYDQSGNLAANQIVYYRLLDTDNPGQFIGNREQVTSNGGGVAEIQMMEGAAYLIEGGCEPLTVIAPSGVSEFTAGSIVTKSC